MPAPILARLHWSELLHFVTFVITDAKPTEQMLEHLLLPFGPEGEDRLDHCALGGRYSSQLIPYDFGNTITGGADLSSEELEILAALGGSGVFDAKPTEQVLERHLDPFGPKEQESFDWALGLRHFGHVIPYDFANSIIGRSDVSLAHSAVLATLPGSDVVLRRPQLKP